MERQVTRFREAEQRVELRGGALKLARDMR
nr:MAG TPA: hypothetical protein [Caudoviricetes sp.]